MVTRYTSYTHLDPLLTRCPCWPVIQPKRPGDLDLLTLKVVSESCDVVYLCANFSLPRPSVLDLGQMYTRQTDSLSPTVSESNGDFSRNKQFSHPVYLTPV